MPNGCASFELQNAGQLQIAITAWLYRILPRDYGQGARLVERGSAFLRFLRKSRCDYSDALLNDITQGYCTDEIVHIMTGEKTAGKTKQVDPKSNQARIYECAGCISLPGCFFPAVQLKDCNRNDSRPRCWGCLLEKDIHHVDADHLGYRPHHEAAEDWLLDKSPGSWGRSVDLETALKIARQAKVVPRHEDKTWAVLRKEHADQERLRRLIDSGKLPPGTTRIPERLNRWAKIPKSRY